MSRFDRVLTPENTQQTRHDGGDTARASAKQAEVAPAAAAGRRNARARSTSGRNTTLLHTCLGARRASGLCSERWERPTKRAPLRRWNVLCIPRPSPAQQSVCRPNGCAPQDDACGRAPQYAIAGLRGTGESSFAASAADTISMCFKWVLSGKRERQRSLASDPLSEP